MLNIFEVEVIFKLKFFQVSKDKISVFLSIRFSS